MITINSDTFIILNKYKIHLKKIEFNFNYFNNKRSIIVSKNKFVNVKNYIRIVFIFRAFKHIVMSSRIKFKNKLKFKALNNIFVKKNQKFEKKKKDIEIAKKKTYNCELFKIAKTKLIIK